MARAPFSKILTALLLFLQHSLLAKAAYTTQMTGGNGNWLGWAKNTRMFVFGASYTATGFSITGTQPSSGNVLGNPSTYKGHTATNGPNFVMYLVAKYNKGPILTYDFAWAGSPVPGVVGQVKDTFIPSYTGGAKLDPGWNPSRTLFACFVGINDLDHWNTADNVVTYRDGVFRQYTDALERLYAIDARNFVLYTVPPLDRAPEFKYVVAAKKAEVVDYNHRLSVMVSNFTKKHKDATIWIVDMNGLFNKILDDPEVFPQTANYRILKSTCKYYSDNWLKLPSMLYKDPSCQYPVNDYFWLNGRHVTYPAHDILAKVTADALAAPV